VSGDYRPRKQDGDPEHYRLQKHAQLAQLMGGKMTSRETIHETSRQMLAPATYTRKEITTVLEKV
jgi:hypothetical protein